MYNKFEQEKNINRDRQTEIDNILKVGKSDEKYLVYKDSLSVTGQDTEHDFIQSQTTKEILLRKVTGKPNLDRKLLQRFVFIYLHFIWISRIIFRLSPTSALSSLDYKVSDLQNKYNKLKFRAEKKSEYLRVLTSESEKNDRHQDGIKEFSKEEQRQRFLENEIHKTGLKMMEADMVRKKYDIILDMLKQERMGYISQIETLEDSSNNQQRDVKRLEAEYKEACLYREEARAELKEKEIRIVGDTKEREKSLVETKRAMKERTDLSRSVNQLLMDSSSSRHDVSSSITSIIRDGDKMVMY